MRALAVGMVCLLVLSALVWMITAPSFIAQFQNTQVIAQPAPSWKIVQIPSITSDVERTITVLTAEGWTLVHVGIESGGVARVHLFFRRP